MADAQLNAVLAATVDPSFNQVFDQAQAKVVNFANTSTQSLQALYTKLDGLQAAQANIIKGSDLWFEYEKSIQDVNKQLDVLENTGGVATNAVSGIAKETETASKNFANAGLHAVSLDRGLEQLARGAEAGRFSTYGLNTVLRATVSEFNSVQKATGSASEAIKATIGSFFSTETIIIGVVSALGFLIENLTKSNKETKDAATAIDDFGKSVAIVKESIVGMSDNAVNLRRALTELGDNAEDIADKSFKNLSDATKKLNDDLGETPNAVEVAQGALTILQSKLVQLTQQYDAVSKSAQSSAAFTPAGIDLSSSVATSQAIIQGQIDATNKLILDGDKKLNEQRIAQLREDLLGQQKVNQKFLEDNVQLQINADNEIESNRKLSFAARRAALADILNQSLQLNKVEQEKELQLATDSESKKNLALEKYRFENLKAQQDYNDGLIKLDQEQADAAAKALREQLKAQADLQRGLKALAKQFGTQDLPTAPYTPVVPNFFGNFTQDEAERQLQHMRDVLEKAGKKVFSSQGILSNVSLLNDAEVIKNFQNLQSVIQQTVKIAQTLGDAFGQVFSTLVSGGKNAFKALEQALVGLIAKLIATIVEAAILSVILNTITGGASSVAGGAGFANILKSLLGTGLKFNAEGGVFTHRTQIGNQVFGEAGPEALIPLDKLAGMMGGGSNGGNVVFRISGSDLVGVLNRGQLRQNRNYGSNFNTTG